MSATNSYTAKPLADQISDYLRANMLDGCAEGQITMHSKVFLEEVSSLVADFIEERHRGPNSEVEWMEDQLIEIMRLASRGLWAPDKDEAITDTLRLHGIRLLVDAYTEEYEALFARHQTRHDATSGQVQEEK